MFGYLLTFSYFFFCSGFVYEYLDIMKPQFYQKRIATHAISSHYGFHLAYDGTKSSYETKKSLSISEISVQLIIFQETSIELKLIRILKHRNETEKLKIKFNNYIPTKTYDFLFNYSRGWNELSFSGSKAENINKITITVHETVYENLEIGEIQVIVKLKLYLSCLEWLNSSSRKSVEKVLMYGLFRKQLENVAKVESGSSCLASSGKCWNSIKDDVLFVDELWIPNENDRNPFIQINFFKKYKIIQIQVNQPMNNPAESCYIKSQQSLLIMNFNKTTNWTSIQTQLETEWLRFHIDLEENDVFYGFYEIKAYAYKPKIIQNSCTKFQRYTRCLDHLGEGKLFQPTSENECDNINQKLDLKKQKTDDHFYGNKNQCGLNSYFCAQRLSINCKKNDFPENLKGTIYYQNNISINILEKDNRCILGQNCTCIDQGDKTIRNLASMASQNLPVEKICIGKKDKNGNNPMVFMSADYVLCQSLKDQLKTEKKELIDNNLQTCTFSSDFNSLILEKTVKSAIEVIIFFKTNSIFEIDCDYMNVYRKDQENCDSESYIECSITAWKSSVSLPFKVCKYYCMIGTIQKIIIQKNIKVSNPIEICEISTVHLNTSASNSQDHL